MSARQHGTRASDATFERVRYEHSPSFVERQSAVRSAARERLGMGDDDVALVEEQAAATSAVPRNDAEAEELRQLAKRERRRQRKLQREAEAEAERLRQLEAMAKRLYVAGFFLLPILWLLYLLYFHKEHKTPDANANIKKMYKRIMVLFPFYTALFVGWVIVFQVLRFEKLNILNFPGRSPANW